MQFQIFIPGSVSSLSGFEDEQSDDSVRNLLDSSMDWLLVAQRQVYSSPTLKRYELTIIKTMMLTYIIYFLISYKVSWRNLKVENQN